MDNNEEVYIIVDSWSYWDGEQAGICEKDEVRYIYTMKDWSDLYPIDENGKDIPRTYDLYPYNHMTILQMPDSQAGWDDWFDKYLIEHEVVGKCNEYQLTKEDIRSAKNDPESQQTS